MQGLAKDQQSAAEPGNSLLSLLVVSAADFASFQALQGGGWGWGGEVR